MCSFRFASFLAVCSAHRASASSEYEPRGSISWRSSVLHCVGFFENRDVISRFSANKQQRKQRVNSGGNFGKRKSTCEWHLSLSLSLYVCSCARNIECVSLFFFFAMKISIPWRVSLLVLIVKLIRDSDCFAEQQNAPLAILIRPRSLSRYLAQQFFGNELIPRTASYLLQRDIVNGNET